MQADAEELVRRFATTYKECEEGLAIRHLTEMLDYLVVENSHEQLGVSPKALQSILDLLRDKGNDARTDFEDLESQKEQFKEIHLLRKHCQDVESEKERL